MRYNRLVYMGIVALGVLVSSCGTQKNTRATRVYHQMKVRYNIQYNGNTAYEEGLKAIRDANDDNYAEVLYLYPVSNHRAAEAAASQMDRTIEKCRKSIKLHSIKAKPKPDPKRQSDPKYRAWLRQEEFNNQLGEAWIRLAEAEFHKGDFLGSVGTLNYVIRHYEYDADVVARCQLLIARAYAELGWQYEAEDMLSRVQQDALTRKHAHLFASASADVLLHAHQYKQALPFIKIATPYEKRKVYRPRFEYVTAQIYQLQGQRQQAIAAYQRVVKLAPPTKMEFHARINMAELEGTSGIKRLRTMTRQSKYKDQLDLIYGTMGNIYLASGDTVRALRHYHIAIDTATQATSDKAAVLVRAGDIHFDRREYALAQPCYQEASTILSSESELYERIHLRAEVLNELIAESDVVTLQDSLQRLSHMSEAEQLAVVERIIKDLVAREKADSLAQVQADRAASNDDGPRSVNTANMLGGGGQQGAWYFYNPQLLRQGKQEFRRKWGARPLEDNWRRQSKTVTTTWQEESLEEALADTDSLSVVGDSTLQPAPAPETDTHKPAYYLQQIPRTAEDLAVSDSLTRQALINMVYIYRDKMHDETLALETVRELGRRYPCHPDMVDMYYSYYLQALKVDDTANLQQYRNQITTCYPTSEQARIVSSSDYFDRLRQAVVAQDSLYERTYEAFSHGRFAEVKQSKRTAEEQYPLSPLMPRFLFLNAVAVARTEGQQAFVGCLQDMVTRYPDNALSAKAKDMLSMLGQGMESQRGTQAMSSLSDRREQEVEAVDTTQVARTLSPDRQVASVVLLLVDGDESAFNRLQYEVALFCFEQFMVRDFDLSRSAAVDGHMVLKVSGFDSMEEAEWWIGLVGTNASLSTCLQTNGVEMVAVSEDNLSLLGGKYTLEEYKTFMEHKGTKK